MVDASRHELHVIADEDLLHLDVARHRRAHPERIPGADHLEAVGIARYREVEGILQVGRMLIPLVLGAQDSVVAGGTGEGGEDLSPVHDPAAVHLARGGAERRPPRRCGRALGERLRVDRALLHHPRVMTARRRS